MDTDKKEGGSVMEKYLTPIAVVVGALIIAGAFAFGHGGAAPAQPAGQKAAVKVDVKQIKTVGDPFIGDPNAPVEMVLWFDYQCPFCKKFDQDSLTLLNDNYVKTGKLRVVFKDFQFLGNDSQTGAEFARAMWEAYPDHFYDWYQAMMTAQDEEGDKGFGNLDSIKALTAKMPGIDVAKVTKLMTDKKAQYDTAISADRDEAQTFGVNGTPAVVVGTTLLSGAQPYTAVTALIDAQLKK